MPSGTPLDGAATGAHAAAADELSALLSPRSSAVDAAITVEFDPSFIRGSVEMWRSATDMQILLHDTFKIHFMERRKPILEGFKMTGKAWLSMMRSMKSTTSARELSALCGEIEAFVKWAEDGLAELAHFGCDHDA
ncbi:hypothetical protein [Trinickia diaoshuihuensis]|uniref:hypothetical protein n=1 Tax=Trinickia diaoshuihuensis TaxID=2292265 RepID=UPI0013C36AE2|nr:hypothetical protein [Trinickia diaoshuihuensis]